MSRSYKKFPKVRVYYGKSGKYGRKRANKKIRSLPLEYEIPNGRGFKKVFNSYEIYDYSCTQFKEWEISRWHSQQQELANGVNLWNAKYVVSLEETLSYWKKFYKCK